MTVFENAAIAASSNRTVSAGVRRAWVQHRVTLLRAAVAVLATLALLKLGESFWRLLWDPGQYGAIDLRLRQDEVRRWFAGLPVYSAQAATYPPASYVLLWPFVGWLGFGAARCLWAVTSGLALVTLAAVLIEASRADSALERAFVGLLLLSMNATGVTIGNGQPLFHFLPGLLGAVLLVRRRAGWRVDAAAASLLLFALVKPTISIPFFWAALCLAGRWRPMLLVAVGYLGVTLLATAFQPGPLPELFDAWLHRGLAVAEQGGYANLHSWLTALGLQRWNLSASAVALLLLGLWTYRQRTADPWIALGVAAIVARIWAYHQMYDDVLIVVPMISLFRIAKGSAHNGSGVVAGILLAITTAVMLVPARLGFPRSPWLPLYSATHALVWIVVLAFLLVQAEQAKSAMHSGAWRATAAD